MLVLLSPFSGAGQQFFDNNGLPLSGGKIYSYFAGTNTAQPTYSTSTGLIPHSNPIILDASGRVPSGEIWLLSNASYKFVLKTSAGILLGTYDNIIPINDASQTIFTGFKGQTGTIESLAGDDGADWIGYTPPGAGAVPESVADKLAQTVSVKDFGAVGDGVTDDTDAIQAAFNSGALNIVFPEGRYSITSVTLRSNSPVSIFGYGATILLNDKVNFGFNLFGLGHTICGLRFGPAISISSDSDTYRGITITTDTTTSQSSFLTLRDIWMTNVYQGIKPVMEATATGRVCYRHTFINCVVENYYNQKTWSGSFGIKFDGVSAGDSSGNDSKVIGGLVKGYEKNIDIIGGAGTKFIGVSIDGGGNAFHMSSTQYIEIVSCYCEYNTTVISWDNNLGPNCYRTFFVGGTMANFTNRTIGTALDGVLWGSDTTGYVWGYPLVGSYLYDTGVVEWNATNAISLKAPVTYFGSNGQANNTIITTYAGSPEGLVTAGLGSLCSDTTNGKLYVKQTGTGNTGWVQK